MGTNERSGTPVLAYNRRGGMPPPDNELLEVFSGGRFTLWRAVSRPNEGPARIGSFAGTLPPGEMDALQAAFEGWRADAGGVRPPPDAAIETIRYRGAEFRMPAGDRPHPDRAAAITIARTLTDTLIEQPLAAVELEVTDGGARLVHCGTEALRGDLSRAAIRVVRWDGDAVAGSWEQPLNGPREVDPGPAWSFDLPFEHGFDTGTALSVAVEDILAFDGHFWVACALEVRVPLP